MFGTSVLVIAVVVGLLIALAIGGGKVILIWVRDPVGPGLPLLACLIVLAAPQMADMMAGMKSSLGGVAASNWRAAELAIGVFLLGLQGWFWSRAAQNARGGYRDRDAPIDMPWQDRWAPRLILVPTTLIAISPLILAWQRKMPWASVSWPAVILAMAVSAGLWWLAFLRRRRHVRRVRRMMAAAVQNLAAPPAPPPLPTCRIARLFAAAPIHRHAPGVLLAVALAGFAVIQAWPQLIDDTLNTPTASLIALSCLVPLGTMLLALLRDLAGLLLIALRNLAEFVLLAAGGTPGPLTVPLGGVADLLGAVLLVAVPVGGSYAFEYGLGWYDVPHAGAADPRPDVHAAIKQFSGCHSGETGPIPVIIVASEGGASRSAAWTLSVMRLLDAKTGGAFGSHLFAITSVSGGSLGAVTYNLALARQFGSLARAPTPQQQLAFWDQAVDGVVELSRADLLSAAIAQMFTSDMLLGTPRRGPTLSASFEHFWRTEGFDLGQQAKLGFLAMRRDRPCLPHLLLNGTDVATGDRLLTSSIGFGAPITAGGDDTSRTARIAQPFAHAVDVVYQQRDTDLPAAASVLNSARFPIISPPGLLPQTAVADAAQPATGDVRENAYQVIDGGVFENYGARTAWELAAAIKLDPESAGTLDPIVVLITNDFDNAPEVCRGAASAPTPTPTRKNTAPPALQQGEPAGGIGVPEFLSSMLGLYSTRGAHARAELATLHRQLCDAQPWHVFHFDLPKPDVAKSQSAPMNWVLDENSCRFMLGAARGTEANRAQADLLREALKEHAAVGADTADAVQRRDAERCGQDFAPAAVTKPAPSG